VALVSPILAVNENTAAKCDKPTMVQHYRSQNQIFVQNGDFSVPHLHLRWKIAMTFGMEKLEWRGYPMVKKV